MTYPSPTHDTAENAALRRSMPGSGWCLRCGVPWRHLEADWDERVHATPYEDVEQGRGFGLSECFPVCQQCWSLMDIEQLAPYYRRLVFDVWEGSEALWEAVRFALEVDCGLRPDPRKAA